ncbi:MAG: hypothetical protein HGN29_07800 [Asgard group archaeon]|nr:hypothetical protein [Asgard group archaeon]
MKTESHKCYSLTKKGNINPSNVIKERMERTDLVIKFFHKLKPEDLNLYINTLKDKLDEIVGDYEFDESAFDWEFLREGNEVLSDFPDFEKTVFLWICKTLKIPDTYHSEKGAIELVYFDEIKSKARLPYYRVKTFAEMYGKEEGIEIYKQVVQEVIKALKSKYMPPKPPNPESITILASNKGSIESWRRIGLVDFTYCIFDDFKIIYRFDNCLTPEALKDFNDPDIAYLATCYIGDAPEWNKDKIIHMRRTQTLHHAKFCDEFYWNNYVHPDAEQPSLEFTRNMGKD